MADGADLGAGVGRALGLLGLGDLRGRGGRGLVRGDGLAGRQWDRASSAAAGPVAIGAGAALWPAAGRAGPPRP